MYIHCAQLKRTKVLPRIEAPLALCCNTDSVVCSNTLTLLFRMSGAERAMRCLRMNFLTIATMSGVIGGVVFGLVLRQCKESWHEREVMYVSYIGEIFLRMLKALILPLIVPSLITAVGSLGERRIII